MSTTTHALVINITCPKRRRRTQRLQSSSGALSRRARQKQGVARALAVAAAAMSQAGQGQGLQASRQMQEFLEREQQLAQVRIGGGGEQEEGIRTLCVIWLAKSSSSPLAAPFKPRPWSQKGCEMVAASSESWPHPCTHTHTAAHAQAVPRAASRCVRCVCVAAASAAAAALAAPSPTHAPPCTLLSCLQPPPPPLNEHQTNDRCSR